MSNSQPHSAPKSRKILVAVDVSETSQYALEQALQLINLQTGTIVLLSVEAPISPPSTSPIPGVFGEDALLDWQQGAELMQLEEKRTHAALDRAETLCQQAGISCVQRLELGDPQHIICDVAKQEAVDLIVVGSHGKGRMERLLLGSVSNYVLNHAHCPVLVVR
jgi:nucleotide-binding universal stress UspA family protein